MGHADGFVFDPTGTRIATNGPRHKIWDVESGELISTLPALPGEGTYALAFSPDGSRLAVGRSDAKVRLFDVASGEETWSWSGLKGTSSTWPSVRTARCSPREATTRIGAYLGLDIDDLLEIARREVTRSLTDEECRQYLHVERCPAAP